MIEPLVFNLALVAAGLGALRAVGVLRSGSLVGLVKAGGLGYLVGVAIVMQLCILLLVIGLPFGLPTIAILCVLLACPLALDIRGWAQTRIDPRALWAAIRRPSGDQVVVTVMMLALAGMAIVGLATLSNSPLTGDDYDAWNLWERKAALMFLGTHLPLANLASTTGGYIHPDYPLVLPLLEAMQLRSLHQYELSSGHEVIFALGVAFAWAGVYIGSRVTRASICALVFPGVLMLVLSQLTTAYADLPMAFFLCLAVLVLGLWFESRDRRDLILSMFLFAGAAGTKNEGLVGSVVVIVGGILVLLAHRDLVGARRLLVAGIAMGALAILPWHLWLAAHNLKSDTPFPSGFSPIFLSHRTARVWPGVKGLYAQLITVDAPSLFVMLAIVAVGWHLVRRSDRTIVAWYYLVAGIFYFGALVWAFWANPLQIQFLVETSANRVYLGFAFICLAGVIHLGASRVVPRVQEGANAPLERRSSVSGLSRLRAAARGSR